MNGVFLLVYLVVWLIISALVAKEGEKRKIGYWLSFIATFFMGFLGIAIVLFSEVKDKEECDNEYCQCSKNKNSKKVE